MLAILLEDERALTQLDADRLRAARATLDTMIAEHGYQRASVRDALQELQRERYGS